MKFTFLLFLIFIFSSRSAYCQQYEGELFELEYNIPLSKSDHFYQIAETKAKFIDFMNIKKGDVVAEIGSEDGVFLGIISTFLDSVTFYAQDINPKALTQNKFGKTVKSYSKYRKNPDSNSYKVVIGNENASLLPENTFDKIFLMTAFHDFDKKDEMLTDLFKKLKPNGQLIIEDGFSFTNDTLICREYGYHQYMIADSLVKMCERHNLFLAKMRNPNFHASHYGNILIFEKDKEKSIEFFKNKNLIDNLVQQSFLLNKTEIASDSNKVKDIINAIYPNISKITKVYEEYDVWLKELALKYLKKKMYQPAINILKANLKFFPEKYQCPYWLGVAYQENKQYDLALACLKSSLTIQAFNEMAKKRIKQLEK